LIGPQHLSSKLFPIHPSFGANIVAYLRKARTVEPEKQPLLVNGSETIFVSRQRHGKHVPAETDTHATIELLLETVFSARAMQRSYKEVDWGN
jgi:hypothetical protein